jgi:hypothetical protein
MTRQMSKTTVKKPARIIRQNAQIRSQMDSRARAAGAAAGPARYSHSRQNGWPAGSA